MLCPWPCALLPLRLLENTDTSMWYFNSPDRSESTNFHRFLYQWLYFCSPRLLHVSQSEGYWIWTSTLCQPQGNLYSLLFDDDCLIFSLHLSRQSIWGQWNHVTKYRRSTRKSFEFIFSILLFKDDCKIDLL